MYICENKNVKILNELPTRRGGQINNKAMVGISLTVEYYGKIYKGIEIVDYIKEKNPRFIVRYKNKEVSTMCGGLIRGKFGGIIDYFQDTNNKEIIDGVLHIHIVNKKGEEFTALYSGEHMDEVMNSNWSRSNTGYPTTCNYNQTGKNISLHQVDLGSWVDHINNDRMDCRIENLRKSNHGDNSKNKNTNNEFGIVGIVSHNKGWYSRYKYKSSDVATKTKHNLEEVKIDALITQRYLGYKHNEDMFYLLDELSEERIKEVTDLLDIKINKANNKIHKEKEYDHNIVDCGEYKKLIKNGKEMLFDCDEEFIRNKRICKDNFYWMCQFAENGVIIQNKFYKELFGLRSNEYKEYDLHVDHLNNNPSDNRFSNLVITSNYSNQCNKQSRGYNKKKSGSYTAYYMFTYKFWNLIGGLHNPTFKTEEEAINEVNRRREIINKYRVKLKSKEELEESIRYCLDNNILLENGLADLDLGYIVKNFGLKIEDVI